MADRFSHSAPETPTDRGWRMTNALKPIGGSALIAKRVVFVIFSGVVLPPLLIWEAWTTASERYRHWLLTAFMTVYGSTIGIGFMPGMRDGPDGVRHLYAVYTQYVGMSLYEFWDGVVNILTLTPGPHQQDLYIHVLSYFVGGVLGLPGLFFTFVAFVYGYFFAGSLVIVLRGWRSVQLPVLTLLIVVTFLLVKNIEGVNTVRTWTGLWVLVYACLRYHETGRWRYVMLMACPPFIHIGWAIMVIPAFVVLIFGSRPVLYSALFFASSLTTFLPSGALEAQFNRTEMGAQMFRSYQRDERVDIGASVNTAVTQGTGGVRIWRVLTKAGVQRWALNAFVLTVVASGVYLMSMSAFQQKIFSIGMLMITLSNSFWFIFALSNRSWVAGTVFIGLAFIMWRLAQGNQLRVPLMRRLYPVGIALSMVLFIPYLAFNASTFLDFPSVFLLGMPFAVWLEPDINITIKEALQFFLLPIM
jgi:hypothetical protein